MIDADQHRTQSVWKSLVFSAIKYTVIFCSMPIASTPLSLQHLLIVTSQPSVVSFYNGVFPLAWKIASGETGGAKQSLLIFNSQGVYMTIQLQLFKMFKCSGSFEKDECA